MLLVVIPLLAFTITSVALTLWAYRFNHRLNPALLIDSESERASRLRQVRKIGVVSSFILLALSLWICASSFPVHAYRHALITLFIATILPIYVLGRVEKKIRCISVNQSALLMTQIRILFGSLVAIVILRVTCAFFSHWIEVLCKQLFQADSLPKWMVLVSAVISYSIGLSILVYLAPLWIRVMFPVQKITDPETQELLTDCIKKTGLEIPGFWSIELDQFKFYNAMVVGSRFGLGPFRRALLFSPALKQHLSPQEFKAIILHEVSHFKLHHIFWRSVGAAIALLTSLTIAFSLIEVARIYFGGIQLALLTGAALIFNLIVLPTVLLRRVVRMQELQADAHAVIKYGASLGEIESALRKLTTLNDQHMNKSDPSSYFDAGSAHPTTEERIASIKKRIDRASLGKPLFEFKEWLEDWWAGPLRYIGFSALGACALVFTLAATHWLPAYRLRSAVAAQDWPTIRTLGLQRRFINSRDVTQGGETPLLAAIQTGNLKLVEFLLNAGADPNLKGSRSNGLLPVQLAVEIGDPQILSLLLHHGADLGPWVDTEKPLTSLAAQYGKSEVLKVLVSKGLRLTTRDPHGMTPLIVAAKNGHLHIVEYLFKNGASISEVDFVGHTALTEAARGGHLGVVKFLLRAGANPHHKCSHGETPLDIAKRKKTTEIERILAAAKQKPTRSLASQRDF